jgi:hypothetical protein
VAVLERGAAGWRVAVAQSTREAVFAARAYASTAGKLSDFVGPGA